MKRSFSNDTPKAWTNHRESPGTWAVQRARYMTLETIAPLSDNPIGGLPAVAT